MTAKTAKFAERIAGVNQQRIAWDRTPWGTILYVGKIDRIAA